MAGVATAFRAGLGAVSTFGKCLRMSEWTSNRCLRCSQEWFYLQANMYKTWNDLCLIWRQLSLICKQLAVILFTPEGLISSGKLAGIVSFFSVAESLRPSICFCLRFACVL